MTAIWRAPLSAAAAGLIACSSATGNSAAADASSPEALQGVNQALSFDGVRDFVTTGTAGFPMASQAQTISLWVLYPSAIGTQTIVVLRYDLVSGVDLGLRNGTLGVWRVYSGGFLVQAPALPAPGTWHHVAYVFDGTVNTLYVDGTSVATSTAGPDNRTPSSSWIGSWDGLTQFYAGTIDEMRIWNVARSRSEIALEIAGRVSASEPGLVAYYACDTVMGSRLPDNSGNGNDGTLGAGNPRFMPVLVPSNVP